MDYVKQLIGQIHAVDFDVIRETPCILSCDSSKQNFLFRTSYYFDLVYFTGNHHRNAILANEGMDLFYINDNFKRIKINTLMIQM